MYRTGRGGGCRRQREGLIRSICQCPVLVAVGKEVARWVGKLELQFGLTCAWT